MVVSGDRDVYQLVGDGIRVMTTSRGVTDTKIYDREGVVERYGVPPELVTDFIGLKGDTSDNIPGVPGIGDKTAAELLQQFGDLEKVLALGRRDLGRQAQAEPDRARRRRPRLEAARDDGRRRRRPARLTDAAARRRTARSCARSRPSSSCGGDPAPRGRVRRGRPGPRVEETIEVEAEEGTPADLADGPISMAIVGGRWAASDGEQGGGRRRRDLAALAADLAAGR